MGHDTQLDAWLEIDGDDLVLLVDGQIIAKRGHPDTPQAKTWVTVEPGWRVVDELDDRGLSVAWDISFDKERGCVLH